MFDTIENNFSGGIEVGAFSRKLAIKNNWFIANHGGAVSLNNSDSL
jgi:hypothetical protein